MLKTLLKSKLHRINVTQVELDYEGSCAVDQNFLDAAGMQEYERVDVYNVTNGERFSTYLILAEPGSKTLSVNGAAAHKVSLNDIVIICTYGEFDEAESAKHKPTLVYFDKDNNVTGIKNSIISEFGLYILYDEITKDIEWPIVKKVTIQNNFFQLLNEYTTEIETRNSKWS